MPPQPAFTRLCHLYIGAKGNARNVLSLVMGSDRTSRREGMGGAPGHFESVCHQRHVGC
jgi:hypothetical protein